MLEAAPPPTPAEADPLLASLSVSVSHCVRVRTHVMSSLSTFVLDVLHAARCIAMLHASCCSAYANLPRLTAAAAATWTAWRSSSRPACRQHVATCYNVTMTMLQCCSASVARPPTFFACLCAPDRLGRYEEVADGASAITGRKQRHRAERKVSGAARDAHTVCVSV